MDPEVPLVVPEVNPDDALPICRLHRIYPPQDLKL
jgi:aspartate-semialdehyde dehydrogenase